MKDKLNALMGVAASTPVLLDEELLDVSGGCTKTCGQTCDSSCSVSCKKTDDKKIEDSYMQ